MSSNRAVTPARLVAGVAAALAAAPMLVAAAGLLMRRPPIIFDGDPAVDEIALIRSAHFEQLVGNYSRYGWSHPGPAWFFALDPFYQALGAQSWALVVATLMLQAIAVLLIVITAWRLGGPVLAVVAAGLQLLYVGLIGDQLFIHVWPPFAVILPMALFLLLAGMGAAGSMPALAGALVVGSYEIQTHVGTTLVLAAVGLTAVVVKVFMDRAFTGDPRWPRRQAGTWDRPLLIAGVAASCLMWVPPLIDEVTGNPGNLTVLWNFFTTHGPQHRWLESISALGHLLDVRQLNQLQYIAGGEVATASPEYVAVAMVFAALSAGLAAVGTLLKDRIAQSIGVLLLSAMVAAAISIRDVLGPVYVYLIFWISTMPLILLLGWVELALRVRPWGSTRVGRALRTAGVAALIAVFIAMSALRVVAFQNVPGDPSNAPGVDYISTVSVASVAEYPGQPVLLQLSTLDMWTLAAGVGLQLVKHGHPVRVQPEWVFMFGNPCRIKGDERAEVIFVRASDGSVFAAEHPADRLIAMTDVYAVFVRRLG